MKWDIWYNFSRLSTRALESVPRPRAVLLNVHHLVITATTPATPQLSAVLCAPLMPKFLQYDAVQREGAACPTEVSRAAAARSGFLIKHAPSAELWVSPASRCSGCSWFSARWPAESPPPEPPRRWHAGQAERPAPGGTRWPWVALLVIKVATACRLQSTFPGGRRRVGSLFIVTVLWGGVGGEREGGRRSWPCRAAGQASVDLGAAPRRPAGRPAARRSCATMVAASRVARLDHIAGISRRRFGYLEEIGTYAVILTQKIHMSIVLERRFTNM